MAKKFRPKSFRLKPELIWLLAVCSRKSGVSETDIVETCIERQILGVVSGFIAKRELIRSSETLNAFIETMQAAGLVDRSADNRVGGRSRKVTSVNAEDAMDLVKPNFGGVASGNVKIALDGGAGFIPQKH